MKYEATIVLFNKELKPFTVEAEGTRGKITDAVNKILKDNEGIIDNIQIVIREAKQ